MKIANQGFGTGQKLLTAGFVPSSVTSTLIARVLTQGMGSSQNLIRKGFGIGAAQTTILIIVTKGPGGLA